MTGASWGQVPGRAAEVAAKQESQQLVYSVGWALGEREKAALALVPQTAREAAIDADGKVRERRPEEACANERCGSQRARKGARDPWNPRATRPHSRAAGIHRH